jgi:hypothetical protein
LPFDIARRGTGNFDPQGLAFRAPYVFNNSLESLTDYTPHRDDDKVAFHCAAHSGETLNCCLPERSRHSPGLEAYARRYRHEQGLITGMANAAKGVVASISLYRAYERCAFSEEERLRMQSLFPHLRKALRISQRLEAERVRRADHGNFWSVAATDCGGALSFAEDRFLALMEKEWPGMSTHTLPRALLETLQRTPYREYVGRTIVVAPFPAAGLIFLKARPRDPVDSLSPRERAQEADHVPPKLGRFREQLYPHEQPLVLRQSERLLRVVKRFWLQLSSVVCRRPPPRTAAKSAALSHTTLLWTAIYVFNPDCPVRSARLALSFGEPMCQHFITDAVPADGKSLNWIGRREPAQGVRGARRSLHGIRTSARQPRLGNPQLPEKRLCPPSCVAGEMLTDR